MTGRELRELRENLDLSLQQLSELSQITVSTIKKQERGDFTIPAGVERIYRKVENDVLIVEVRWVVAGKRPTDSWRRGPWTVYRTKKIAHQAAAAAKELLGDDREVVKVWVRKKLAEYPGREEWRDAHAYEEESPGE